MEGLPTIRSYGPYSNSNYGAHALKVSLGNSLDVYFSYETPVAYHESYDGLVCRENDWGPTTGKQLNCIEPNKKARIPGMEFEQRLVEVLKRRGLIVPNQFDTR